MPRKPGYLTTEFWLTVAVDLAMLATALASVLPPKWAALSGTVATGLYALARGWAKSQPVAVPVVTAPPQQVPTDPIVHAVVPQPPSSG